MPLQDQLGDKLANPLHIEQLNDVYLISKFLLGVLVPFKSSHSCLEALFLSHAATAQFHERYDQVL